MSHQRFTKQFEIYYYQIDRHQKATPVSLLNLLEETAISHSDSVGLGVQTLLSQGLCWILNRWSFQMDRYPALNEKITVETWPSHFEKFYATRQFLIKDSDGNIIGRAVTLWILLNFERRRPTRVPDDFGDKYGMDSTEAIPSPFSGLDTNFAADCGLEFLVRRSDIDTNQHVNNSKYVEWALEAVPQDIYDQFSLKSLEVEYKKEISYGASVYSGCKFTFECSEKCEFSHRITNSDQSLDHALAKTIWIRC
ncbi:MAG: thioesterase [Clostridia bacterium]|nr:thioesterase [Clostridia bacterium]